MGIFSYITSQNTTNCVWSIPAYDYVANNGTVSITLRMVQWEFEELQLTLYGAKSSSSHVCIEVEMREPRKPTTFAMNFELCNISTQKSSTSVVQFHPGCTSSGRIPIVPKSIMPFIVPNISPELQVKCKFRYTFRACIMEEYGLNDLHTDCTLVIDKQPVRVHRPVLMSQSVYFTQEFMIQRKQPLFKAEYVINEDYHIFIHVLNFFYGRSINAQVLQNPHHYYMLGQRYGIARLTDLCVDILIRTVATDTVPKLLALIEIYHSIRLETVLHKFIKQNISSGIFFSVHWFAWAKDYDRIYNGFANPPARYYDQFVGGSSSDGMPLTDTDDQREYAGTSYIDDNSFESLPEGNVLLNKSSHSNSSSEALDYDTIKQADDTLESDSGSASTSAYAVAMAAAAAAGPADLEGLSTLSLVDSDVVVVHAAMDQEHPTPGGSGTTELRK